MKKGEIVCYQIRIYPQPLFKRDTTPYYWFNETIANFGRHTLQEPIAYWRIKKLKQAPEK